MNLNPIHTACLIVGLLTIPPSTGNPGSLLNQFDLLALTRPPTQSTLLISSTTSKLLPLPPVSSRSYYTSITPDPSTDKIYWSTNKGVIGYSFVNNSSLPNVIRNASSPTSIVDLTFSNSRVYWVEDDTLIKSMKPDGSDIKTLAKATSQEKIQGLTVNQQTGTIYYTTWQRYHRTSGSIYKLPQTSPPTPLLTDLILPASLTISPTSTLSWISNPPSDHFTIERLNTLDPQPQKITTTKQANHGYSIASTCTGVYYTVANDKHVWRVGSDGGKELDFGVDEHAALSFRKVVGVPRGSCPEPVDKPVTLSSEMPSSDSPVASQEQSVQRDAPKDMDKQTAATETAPTVTLHNTPTTTTPENPTTITTTTPQIPTSEPTPANPQLRFCTNQESESTCGSKPNHICVLISNTPVCLCQLPHCAPVESQLNPTESSSTQEPQRSTPQQPWPPESIIIISVLATLATVMSMISLYMTIRVRTLSKKPIIRRRVVVRTSESGSSTPASVCEMIDIENCCNMNVCETPCYERTLLQPSTSSTQTNQSVITVNSSNSNWTGCGGPAKKEDKKCLLR